MKLALNHNLVYFPCLLNVSPYDINALLLILTLGTLSWYCCFSNNNFFDTKEVLDELQCQKGGLKAYRKIQSVAKKEQLIEESDYKGSLIIVGL